MASGQAINLDREIGELEKRAVKLQERIFSDLSPYEITQLSRHFKRPTAKTLIEAMTSSFIELHGDRNFYDDRAIVGGIGVMDGESVVLIGNQKGRSTKENIERNFGMAKPEGYRKALRLMSMAERFRLPVVCLIDTPGADPGIGAEERGQSEAIAKNILVMSRLKVPIVAVVIGDGGSGGALALGVANRVHMLQYATYSVISPEGCASILWKDAAKASEMAGSLQLIAKHALERSVIDSIIPEPLGGAHRAPLEVAANLKKIILSDLEDLSRYSSDELSYLRREKYMNMGSLWEKL